MRRFDAGAQFDRLAARGAPDVGLMPALAETIAEFHAQAERRPTFGGAAVTGGIAADQLGQLAAARQFAAADLARLKALWGASLTPRNGTLLDRRARGGFVRH